MTTIIPFKILTIGDQGFHLLMKIKINGKIANVILDTGASTTVFDIKRIQKYTTEKKFDKQDKLSTGLGSSKIKSEITILKKINLGTLQIKNYTAILLDLSNVNKSYEQIGIKHIEGILGNDILKTYHAVINYQKKSIQLKYTVSKK